MSGILSHGDSLTIQCDKKHLLRGRNSVIVCDHGRWKDDELPTCDRISKIFIKLCMYNNPHIVFMYSIVFYVIQSSDYRLLQEIKYYCKIVDNIVRRYIHICHIFFKINNASIR